MAVRNLTRKFVDIRNAQKANRSLLGSRDDDADSSGSGLLNANKEKDFKASLKATLPPLWVDKIDQAEEDIAKIQTKMRELATLHSKRLMVSFESGVDELHQEQEIDICTSEITQLFRHAEGILKQFSKQGDETQISTSERTVRNNMQRSLAKKLQGLSSSFRGSQKEYLARMRHQKSGTGSKEFEFMSAKSQSMGDIDLGFTSAQLQVLDDTEELVQQRDEEINRIAKSIEELAQIFRELAVLVIDQGTILDRIDYNMEQTVEQTKEGVAQLVKAEQHQKSAMPFWCICGLVMLIALMVILLIVKHSH